MTPRPPPIALDDLARPRYNDEARAVLDLMAAAAPTVSLQPADLVRAAREETGLDDLGPDVGARLDILCRALRDEARLNGAGVVAQSVFLTGLLRNRLLLEDLVARHPEILDVVVARPIFICGLPRTGTTHLHNLMSSDPALRSLPYWESVEPVLAEREWPADGAPDPAVGARTEGALSFLDIAMPEFKRMHEMTVDHVHEEIQLLAIDLSTMLFETIAPIPTWRDHYLGRDQRPSYAYLKRILQALQWLRGGSRWVLKSPQHLEQFPVLLDVFPDATFVVTHRDPVSVTASMVTMLAYSARLGHDEVDLRWIGDYWADRLGRMLRACVEWRDVLPPEQSIDVPFETFMEDDVAMVRRIYAVAGQPFTGDAAAAMRHFMDDHPRGRHGGVLYDLDQFGLERATLRRSFGVYTDRFALAPEA